jgi:diguanylate cyclase
MASNSYDDNERRGIQREELIRLLCRALSRLAVAAHGVDRRLDQMLGELRQLLRRDIDDPAQLVELVDSIDSRIKLVDDERDLRSDMVQRALQQLIEQLLALRPAATLAGELKSLLRTLKGKPEDGEDIALLVRLPDLQAQVLQGDSAPRSGLLARWFGGGAAVGTTRRELPASEEATPAPRLDVVADTATDEAAEDKSTRGIAVQVAPKPRVDEAPRDHAPIASAAADLSTGPVPADGEPPFARISTAVCDVLGDLLQQIEPPPTASENYQHARDQISKGLNWYELVSTLEEVSLVVLAALERDQGDFQSFLLTLNHRLEQAHQALQSSLSQQNARASDDATLNETVRKEVAQIEVQVAEATQLEVLKTEVKQRLSTIVGAMDQHKSTEQLRQVELEQQLANATARLKEVESHAVAVERRLAEQQRLALLDMLTQLPNRHAYEERLEQEFERWQRYRHPLVLAVLDVDHFKSINDNYGHLAGDKVLRIIAKTLRTRLRKTDFIGRFGGEEFVVLMPETPLEAALQTLEAMCGAVAECPFHFRAQPVSITLSGGVAEFVDGVAAETIFERADAALYRAKADGRNRCVVARQ